MEQQHIDNLKAILKVLEKANFVNLNTADIITLNNIMTTYGKTINELEKQLKGKDAESK